VNSNYRNVSDVFELEVGSLSYRGDNFQLRGDNKLLVMCQLQRVIGYSSIYRIYRGASSTAVQAIEAKIYSFTIEMN